jgi:hypothetical protein
MERGPLFRKEGAFQQSVSICFPLTVRLLEASYCIQVLVKEVE